MKKNIIYPVILLTVFGVMMSCDPKDIDEIPQVLNEVTVFLPDDLEEIELDYQNPTKPLAVEWKTEEGLTYEFVVSLDEDMSNPASIALNASGTDALTHQQLDSIMAVLGVKIYNRAELYWVIKGNKGISSGSSKSRIMDLWRFMNPFVDPRDGEVYRVMKVVDKLTGNYAIWMADNMRTVKYSDGTPLVLETDVKFSPALPGDSEYLIEWSRLRGGYYTWNATVRDVEAAERGQKVQGIAPDGWHIATKQEWIDLINLQDDNSNPARTLKHSNFWVATSVAPGNNASGFNLVATGFIWDPLKDHNLGRFDTETLLWSSTVPVEGDDIPWNPPASNFPNQAYSFAFNADGYGVALYVYNRFRGYNVRCVLD